MILLKHLLLFLQIPQSEPEKVVHAIFEKSAEHLKASGELWIVIQKKQGAPSAIEKLEELFDEVSVVQKKKGYYIIKAKKFDSVF